MIVHSGGGPQCCSRAQSGCSAWWLLDRKGFGAGPNSCMQQKSRCARVHWCSAQLRTACMQPCTVLTPCTPTRILGQQCTCSHRSSHFAQALLLCKDEGLHAPRAMPYILQQGAQAEMLMQPAQTRLLSLTFSPQHERFACVHSTAPHVSSNWALQPVHTPHGTG